VPKETPAPTPAQPEEIELLAPHDHAGRSYPAGSRLNLALHGLAADSAAWLIGIGVARQVPPILTPAAAAAQQLEA